MIDCPYSYNCNKSRCDTSCSQYSECLHWMNRCRLNTKSPVFDMSKHTIIEESQIILRGVNDNLENSGFIHLSVTNSLKPFQTADRLCYTIISKYCQKFGISRGVYKLDYSEYLDAMKASWNRNNSSEKLENMQIWYRSARYLVIHNLSLVRYNDFESQTLLGILQERSQADKCTILVLDASMKLSGKFDSIFFTKLKHEISIRGVDV